MPTHLYCLLAASSDSAAPADAPDVRALVVGDIVGWVTTVSDLKLSREGRRAAQQVVEHDAVIARALARGVTPVPATLADPYSNDAMAISDIIGRTLEILSMLQRVDHAVEMAVILGAVSSPVTTEERPDLAPGRAYLERLRDLPALLESAADQIDRSLAHMALAASRRVERDRVGLSHLIRRSEVDEYRKTALRSASGRFRLMVDGPRAPYSFAAFSPASGVL